MNEWKILGLLLALVQSPMAHAQFTDNFSDGELASNPPWTGDRSKFVVNSGKLKLQAPAVAETAFLTTITQAIHQASWEFYLQMDFNPSSANYAKVYLVSDQQDLNSALNGYFVKVGNTSRDISLYRQGGTAEVRIIDGLDDRVNLPTVKVRIKVTRSGSGLWELFSDTSLTGNYLSEGTVTDNIITTSAFFGVQCIYTSTRSDKFWFDDFIVSGGPVPDTTPPTLLKGSAVSELEVDVFFSEPLDPTTAQDPANYSVGELLHPSAVILNTDQQSVRLNLSSRMTNGLTYLLKVAGIKDRNGNTMIEASVPMLYFIPFSPDQKDIILTEIFPDPFPQIGLPSLEFAEIYNRSEKPFNLTGWKLTDGSSTAAFPDHMLLPGEYLIVTSSSAMPSFVSYGSVVGIANFPTLNNSGDVLVLKDANELTIDSIHYTLDWYRDEDKSEGGWTLELIDINNPCGEEDNWSASENSAGGTPGKQNSVYANKPDLIPPVLNSVFPETPDRLFLTFNEKLSTHLQDFHFFLQDVTISKIFFDGSSLRNLKVELATRLLNGRTYNLEVSGVRDCAGNEMPETSISFGLPEKAEIGDVIINEILFNPRPGGSDYVEFYNASTKTVNLGNWKTGNLESNVPVNVVPAFNGNLLMAPGSYVVITEDPSTVVSQYPFSDPRVIYRAQLPSLPDDEGSVCLLNEDGVVLDALAYRKEWHSEFLKSDDGVSLERISVLEKSDKSINWISASSLTGYGTPGIRNSQFRSEDGAANSDITVTPEIFTPGEGINSFVLVQYSFAIAGQIANVRVFDREGYLICTLANNMLIGTEGFLRWDGNQEGGGMARMGYYIIWFEVFNASGAVTTFRKRVVIAPRSGN